MILSPSLAWLENYHPPYDGVVDVMRWCIRRSLIYPYIRNYTLAMKLLEDVSAILTRGRRTVIRCLLQLHRIMERSEAHYLFNKLCIDPLIGWVQRCEEEEVQDFGKEVTDVFSEQKEKSSHVVNENNDNESKLSSGILGKGYLDLELTELEESLVECHHDEATTSSDDESESSCNEQSSEDDGETINTADEEEEKDGNLSVSVDKVLMQSPEPKSSEGPTPQI